MQKSQNNNDKKSEKGASVLFDKMTNQNIEVDEIEYPIKETRRVNIPNEDYERIIKGSNHTGSIVNTHKVPTAKQKNKKQVYQTAEEKKNAAIQDNYTGPTCPYCGNKTVIKTAKEHIGKDEDYCYWTCQVCNDVSVTTVKGSYLPAGVPGDLETRKLRMKAHKHLYGKKKELKFNNNALNKWISNRLSIEVSRAWIGHLDKVELKDIVLARYDEIYEEKYSSIFNKID